MIRPPLQVDSRYALIAGLLALVFAAAVTIAAFVITTLRTDPAPSPTTYIVGPAGDDVEVHP